MVRMQRWWGLFGPPILSLTVIGLCIPSILSAARAVGIYGRVDASAVRQEVADVQLFLNQGMRNRSLSGPGYSWGRTEDGLLENSARSITIPTNMTVHYDIVAGRFCVAAVTDQGQAFYATEASAGVEPAGRGGCNGVIAASA